jgi:spoIIIJ-associated protein
MNQFVEMTGKTVDEALTSALIKLETTSEKVEYEVVDKGSSGILGFINSKPAKILVWKKASMEDGVKTFLNDVFAAMDLQVTIEMTVNEEESVIDINLVGDDMGVLIGKRGQTLDSLQYLVSLVAKKEGGKFYRVKLDTENYRDRRKATLESLAKNIAYKVKRTRRPVSLEPMNPYERRIIHSALQGDKYVSTKSEGEEPFRHVVVILKK